MKSKKFKDNFNRMIFQRIELKHRFLKTISRDQQIPLNMRWIAQIQINRLNRKSSIVKIQNRCIWTSQARSVDSKLGFSRINLRSIFLNAKVPGVKKAIW